jgi:DNA-binding NarL/FixJ family response regulator
LSAVAPAGRLRRCAKTNVVSRRRLVLVEDHPAVGQGIKILLERSGFEVLGLVASAAAGYDLIGSARPDVALIDIGLPDESGIELARRLLRRDADLGIVFFTGVEDAVALRDALDCGARGFVRKTAEPDTIVAAVSAVAAGGSYVDREARAELLHRDTTETLRVLTVREREVLDLLAQGLTGEDVAERLVLSSETVKTHIRNAMTKLEAHTRVHAVAIALREGFISGPDTDGP